MPPLITWLARHGQSTANVGRLTDHWSAVDLTDLGRRQALALAERVEHAPDLVVASPMRRAQATAAPILARWPDSPHETWPIQELTYLSPARFAGGAPADPAHLVEDYWRRADPDYLDGDGAETFRRFLGRVRDFHDALARLELDFVVVVGHGQFFKAYLWALTHGFEASAAWMTAFRAAEILAPIDNGEIVTLRAGG